MNKKLILIIIAAVVVCLGAFFYLKGCETCLNLDAFKPESIRNFIQSFGPAAIVVYVLLYTANTFSPFFPPIFIMSLAAGAVFGPLLGTIALYAGTMCGTSAAFFAARYVARRWVEQKIKGNAAGKANEYYEKLGQNGFFILLPMRIIGFPPYGIIDFICGVSSMRFWDFFLATFIGAAPWIITQVLLADRFANFNPKDPVLWGLLIAFITMIVVTGKIVNKKQKEDKRI